MYNNIKIAVAVSHSNKFESVHFGNADKYLIFEWNGREISLQNELTNSFKSFDEEQVHGSKKKGNLIIELLKENNIQVLVSKQFGINIKMVNRHFIPVIINKDTSEDILLAALIRHIFWIEEELKSHRDEYKLFIIKKGILKTAIEKTK